MKQCSGRLWPVGFPVTARRVVRGGAWNNNQTDARAAYRNFNAPDNRNNNLGFRLARASHTLAPLRRRGVKTRCERTHRHRRRGRRFRHWPPTPVRGPRRRGKDGAGESRPHGGSFDRPSGL
ncbi:MAG: SUMF1/EgtB/PvdO family nonheme iron enzyme [Candidatus Contendobacter sp.]|nr:SUMF1/EgtB/PvdO family nonheme iron enzyme [Candidatus Contendobacter sp.]